MANRKLVFINEHSGSSYRAELICMLRVLPGISVNYCQPLCVCSYVTVGGNYIKCGYLRGWPLIYNICKLRPMFLLYTYVKTCWTCIFFCCVFSAGCNFPGPHGSSKTCVSNPDRSAFRAYLRLGTHFFCLPEKTLAALTGHGVEVEARGLVTAHAADPRHVPIKLIGGQGRGTYDGGLHH